ncbi:MAG: mandelate racemase/muconate lactonizing enzyme family protein [Candidatus Latescibacteria bacterium]|nr:mandelate racemase/muconate lactonizing enzyme family protein [Candidatus Latescibacterota bacterium]
MKITHTDIWTVVVPTVPGTVHSNIPTGWDQVPKHILRVRTDDGIDGIGETGRGCPLDEVQAFAKQVEGKDPRGMCLQNFPAPLAAPLRAHDRSWESPWGGQGPAYDAFEMALFDILGKHYGLPAHALLGGACRDRVKADYWIGHQTVEEGARSARKGYEQGFKGIKLKCTSDEPMVERVRAIRDATSVDFKVTVDPNQRFYRPSEAIALAKAFEALGNVEVLEDPMRKWNLDWYRQLRAATTIPVALHLGDPNAIISAIKAEAVDYLNLGGSMTGFVKNAALAQAAGIPVWHGSGNDLGIIETAYLHTSAAAPNCVLACDFVGSWTREDDLIVEGLKFEDGYAVVPMKPGLGCELDMKALEKYRVSG